MDISLTEEMPVQIQAGYYKDGQYYFDVFLAAPEENKALSPSQYKKFTARLDKFAGINILLTKAQIRFIGNLNTCTISQPNSLDEKRVGNSFGDCEEADIGCMLPVVRTSKPSKLFRIQRLLHGLQEVMSDPTEEPNFNEEIIVGKEFLRQMGFNFLVSGPSWMHVREAEARDLEPWDLKTEGLGMLEFGKEEITKEIGERQNEDEMKFDSEDESFSLENFDFEEEKLELKGRAQEIKEWAQGDVSIDQLKKFVMDLLDLVASLPFHGKEGKIISLLKKFQNEIDV